MSLKSSPLFISSVSLSLLWSLVSVFLPLFDSFLLIACVCICMCVGMHEHICTWKCEVNVGCLVHSLPYRGGQVIWMNQSSPFQPVWLITLFQRLPVPAFHALGLQTGCCAHPAWHWISGSKLQSHICIANTSPLRSSSQAPFPSLDVSSGSSTLHILSLCVCGI